MYVDGMSRQDPSHNWWMILRTNGTLINHYYTRVSQIKTLNTYIFILYRTFTVFIGLSLVHTYSMERSLSWEANRFSASQEIRRILWNRFHKCLPPVPVRPCHHGMGRLRLRMEERPPMWRVAANILNKQSRTADKGWYSSLVVGRGSNNSSP